MNVDISQIFVYFNFKNGNVLTSLKFIICYRVFHNGDRKLITGIVNYVPFSSMTWKFASKLYPCVALCLLVHFKMSERVDFG